MELIQKHMELLQIPEVCKFYINTKGSTTATGRGESMLPIIQDGWRVKIKPVSAKEIACGDVIVFTQKELICHRIIGKFKWNEKLYFIESADSETIGRVIEQKDLVGKITEVFDADGRKIDEKIWQRSFDSSVKTKLLAYIYLPLFLTKRLFFGKRQNRFTSWIFQNFWRFYCIDK